MRSLSRALVIAVVFGMAGLSGCFDVVGCIAGCDEKKDKPIDTPVVLPPVDDTISNVTEPVTALPHFPNDGASVMEILEIASFDSHQIPMTIYKPAVASAEQQVPMILHSHGFTGKRFSTEDAVQPLIAAGFGVVSFDERGHGDAKDDSEVYFMHPDYEVQDVIKVIDHISTLDWVLMEPAATASVPNDPVLGAIGGSYGGAYQLMTAIFDPRLDAIVPEITWNDIVDALAPNGAIKSGWVDLFYLAGNAQQSVVFSEDFHKGWAWAAASNEFPAGQGGIVPDLESRLKESSPATYPGKITIPTLLIQGMPDTLFPLNQAVANLEMLEAANVTSALYTHLAGHILNTASLASQVPVPVGLQGLPGGKPCGELIDLQIAWHLTHLLGLDAWDQPRVCISLEDETSVVGETFPLPGTEMAVFELGGPTPVLQAPAGPGIEIPLLTATEDMVIAGIPGLEGSYLSPGADAIVYFSIKWAGVTGVEAIVDDQVTPLRITGPNAAAYNFDIDLGGIGVRLAAGDELLLVVSTVEPMYAGNAERIPGVVVLDDLKLELPIVPADTPGIVLPA